MGKTRAWIPAISAALLLWAPAGAIAQINPPPTYAGDLWSRPRLTGEWFGGPVSESGRLRHTEGDHEGSSRCLRGQVLRILVNNAITQDQSEE